MFPCQRCPLPLSQMATGAVRLHTGAYEIGSRCGGFASDNISGWGVYNPVHREITACSFCSEMQQVSTYCNRLCHLQILTPVSPRFCGESD